MGQTVPSARRDSVAGAIASIVIAVSILSAGDAIIKLVGANYLVWQLFVLRSLFLIPVYAVLIQLRKRRYDYKQMLEPWVLLRSLLLVLMWLLYYVAIQNVELSLAAAAYYTAPLMITMWSTRIAGERVGRLTLLGVCFGFTGALIMLKPTSVEWSPYLILPFITAWLYAAAMITTRLHCIEKDPVLLALALNLTFIVVGLVGTVAGAPFADVTFDSGTAKFLIGQWSSLSLGDLGVILLLSAVMIFGSIFGAMAYQLGSPPLVATFDYTYLVCAVLWGWLFFNERPDWLSTIGMLMVLVGGVVAIQAQKRQPSISH